MNEAKVSRALANAHEEALFERVAAEVDKGDVRPGLWAKALSSADGDEQKARARYLSLRVEQIQIQLSAAETIESGAPARSSFGLPDNPAELAQILISVGCRVRKLDLNEWEILHPSGAVEVARSAVALRTIAGQYSNSGSSAA